MDDEGRARPLRRLSFVALTLIGLGLLPPVQARMKAVAVLAEALGFPFPRPFAATVERHAVTLDGVSGHLYSTGSRAPGIIFIPGVAPEGKNDSRVVRAALAIAAAERTVFVPDLELIERRFVEEDIDRIVRAATALSNHPLAAGKVTLLGFSYGGSFALIAAADERLAPVVEQVAVFGAYFDLVGVIQAVTTTFSVVEGRAIRWDPHPRAEEVLERVSMRFVPERDRPKLRAALDGKVAVEELNSGSRALYELLVNRDPARTYELASRLDDDARATIATFSPSEVAARIDVPVVAMHSKDDPVVPFGEAIRLEDGLSDVRLVAVNLFQHVNFEASSPSQWIQAADDLFSGWRFTSWVLSAQE